MRYDAEQGIIEIRLDEFVSIARRGISPSVSSDDFAELLDLILRVFVWVFRVRTQLVD